MFGEYSPVLTLESSGYVNQTFHHGGGSHALCTLCIGKSDSTMAFETPLLPLEVLRELLAFLPLDDREHLTPLNRTLTRILTPVLLR